MPTIADIELAHQRISEVIARSAGLTANVMSDFASDPLIGGLVTMHVSMAIGDLASEVVAVTSACGGLETLLELRLVEGRHAHQAHVAHWVRFGQWRSEQMQWDFQRDAHALDPTSAPPPGPPPLPPERPPLPDWLEPRTMWPFADPAAGL